MGVFQFLNYPRSQKDGNDFIPHWNLRERNRERNSSRMGTIPFQEWERLFEEWERKKIIEEYLKIFLLLFRRSHSWRRHTKYPDFNGVSWSFRGRRSHLVPRRGNEMRERFNHVGDDSMVSGVCSWECAIVKPRTPSNHETTDQPTYNTWGTSFIVSRGFMIRLGVWGFLNGRFYMGPQNMTSGYRSSTCHNATKTPVLNYNTLARPNIITCVAVSVVLKAYS